MRDTKPFYITPDQEYGPDEFWQALDSAHPELSAELRAEDYPLTCVTCSECLKIKQLPAFHSGAEHAPTALRALDPSEIVDWAGATTSQAERLMREAAERALHRLDVQLVRLELQAMVKESGR